MHCCRCLSAAPRTCALPPRTPTASGQGTSHLLHSKCLTTHGYMDSICKLPAAVDSSAGSNCGMGKCYGCARHGNQALQGTDQPRHWYHLSACQASADEVYYHTVEACSTTDPATGLKLIVASRDDISTPQLGWYGFPTLHPDRLPLFVLLVCGCRS